MLALLVVVLAFGVWPLLTGAARPKWDAAAYYAPAVGLVGDFARSGQLLTWDPWVVGGRPAYADPQAGAASPVVALAALAGGQPLGGFLVYWLAIWLLGGVGVLVLGRSLRAPPWAGLCAAVGFVSCGYFTGHGQHTTILFGFATLPWFVWRLDRAIATRSFSAAVQAGAIWGLAGLSGYPGLVIIHGLYGGCWAIGRAVCGGLPGSEAGREVTAGGWRRRLVWLPALWASVLAAALVVLAPTYLSFFVEGKASTTRTEPLSRYWAVERGALHPSALVTVGSPAINALAIEGPPGTLFQGEYSMAGIYLSPVVLAFGFVGLVPIGGAMARRARWRWWLFVLAAVTFAAALGDVLPVRGWLYELVPPTRYFRFPALFRGYALFSIVVLALEAGAALDRHPPRRAWVALASLSALLGVVGLWSAGVASQRLGEPLPLDGWGGWAVLAWLGPAAAALLAALGGRGIRRWALAALVALALCDAAASIRLAEPLFATRQPGALRHWEQLERLYRAQVTPLPGGLHRGPQGAWGLEDNRNQVTKQAVFGGYDQRRNRYHRRWVRNPTLTAFVTGTDRIWFAPRLMPFERVTPLPGSDEPSLLRVPTPDLERFAGRAARVGGLLPVIHPVPGRAIEGALLEPAGIEDLPAMTRLPFKVLEATPETLMLRVDAPEAGWLVVTDRYSPAWKASIDGRPAPVHEAAFLFRAVALGAGVQNVRFELRLAGYRTLVAASWTLLAAAFFAAPCRELLRRRRSASRTGEGETASESRVPPPDPRRDRHGELP